MPSPIATRLKAARAKLALSQSEAAKEWGVNKRTLESWEHGRREPKGLALKALEGILGAIEKKPSKSR